MAKSLLFLLAAGMMLSSSVCSYAAENEETITLYGVRGNSTKSEANGVYSVKAVPGAQPECVWADGSTLGNAGAVYTDSGTLYVLSYYSMWGETYWGYQICDFAERTYEYLMTDQLNLVLREDVAGTMTYDPSTDTIYGVCLGNEEGGADYVLTSMNPANAKKTVVAGLPQRLFTLAVTARGEMYGVGGDGWLYKVNKITGELTPIGDTGIIPYANQSAVIDYKTNVMYWSAYSQDKDSNKQGALYSVDLTTGKPTLITVYDDCYQLFGLFIEQVAQVGSAPAAVTDFTPNFEGASLEGNFTFTLPTLDINGNDLKGSIEYSVACDGEVAVSGSGQPGEAVVAPVSVPETGTRRFVLSIENGGELGPAVSHEMWVGMDTPKAVEDMNVSIDGDLATVSWTLPERGIHGGFVDHELTRYKIVRGPENIVVAQAFEGTTFTETVTRDGVYPLMYIVNPEVDGLVGESVLGNTVLVGDRFVPPFSLDLRDPFMTMIFNIVDVNGDSASWEYNMNYYVMCCLWPLSNDYERNDWLITPGVFMEPGFDYKLKIKLRSEGAWNYDTSEYEEVFAGSLGAYMGNDQKPSSMVKTLLESEEVTDFNWYERETDAITVENEGLYYFGFHVTGGVERGNIYDILVESISMSKKESSGVEVIGAERFSVVGGNGLVSVHNPHSAEVRIVTLDGRQVAATADKDATIALNKGMYIAVCGGESVKIVVR